MKDTTQTALVYLPKGSGRKVYGSQTSLDGDCKCFEYPMHVGSKQLKDSFSEIGCNIGLAEDMVSLGFDPPMNRGVVYAYIENRRPMFKDKWYGWGKARN